MNKIKGKVIRVLSPMEIVINLGASHGITGESRFIVFETGDEVTDPDSGESLGQLEIVKGKAEAKHVQEKMSTLRSLESKKVVRDRLRPHPPGLPSFSFNNFPQFETVTEEVEVSAPFDDVKEGDLVRAL